MNIGQAAKATGVSAKMIRYYESIDLVPHADRRESGYRDYGPPDLHRLGFIRHARDLGFSLERVRVLLGLWSDQDRSNAEVKAIALTHVLELEHRARQLRDMATSLRQLADACDGDGRPDCPIIAGLETGQGVPACHPAAVTSPEPPTTKRRAAPKPSARA
jgi:Cu(I)-responsive transcriptional regulator